MTDDEMVEAAILNKQYCRDAVRHAIQMEREACKREWQGLTDEEIEEGAKQSWVSRSAFESSVWWAEAKLKEKNHGQ
jgi:hypothetical protein